MTRELIINEITKELSSQKNILIIQDLDGVCIPLVRDPLTRRIDLEYINAASRLKGEFFVLTNGEHNGQRGVNTLVEKAYLRNGISKSNWNYLPGLAAGGVEYQNIFGEISIPGVSISELNFLNRVPGILKDLLSKEINNIIGPISDSALNQIVNKSIIDTKLSPTVNMNYIFTKLESLSKRRNVQQRVYKIMKLVLKEATDQGLINSFYLHIAPNLGKKDGNEILKLSTTKDIGSTDIQFMLKGAIKESGLLVLINKYIESKKGYSPLGEYFNSRDAPHSMNELLDLCKEKIPKIDMPVLIGVGDTVTSSKLDSKDEYMRGGSDRGFLTLIQEIGKEYNVSNKILLVDSSDGEVQRPSMKDSNLVGISDPKDPLKFDFIFTEGPKEYIQWFESFTESRLNNISLKKNK